MTQLHITWSIEVDDKCPCGGELILCCAPSEWEVDPESEWYVQLTTIGVPDLSAHICSECGRCASISVNEVNR